MMVGRWLHVIFIQCIAGYQWLSIHSWTGSPYWSTIGIVRVIMPAMTGDGHRSSLPFRGVKNWCTHYTESASWRWDDQTPIFTICFDHRTFVHIMYICILYIGICIYVYIYIHVYNLSKGCSSFESQCCTVTFWLSVNCEHIYDTYMPVPW
jgi:hypothetical protein